MPQSSDLKVLVNILISIIVGILQCQSVDSMLVGTSLEMGLMHIKFKKFCYT